MDWFESAQEHLAKWKEQEAAWKKTFTPRALQVFGFARQEADRLNNNYVGTEHLLLSLFQLGDGVAFNVLHKLGLSLETVRLEVKKLKGLAPGKNIGPIPYTARTKKVIEIAKEEAKTLGHVPVDAEHLLLGLLQEREGPAAAVFKHLNVDMEKVKKELMEEICC